MSSGGSDDILRDARGVVCLGEALGERIEDVISGMRRRAAQGSGSCDEVVETYFTDMARVSTRAFAEWLSGSSEDVAREAGRDAWHILGQLAAAHEASLVDVIKRQLQWRDSLAEVLIEQAAEIETSDRALTEALEMLRRSLDVTLVRMGGSFETERQHTHADLVRRDEELTFLATHDALTGLPNRTLILDRLDQMLNRAARNQMSAAAVFIDLDNFKAINDSLGHAVGDELLCAFATRLSAVVRETDALGRLGGDEFVVVTEDQFLSAGPELLAERLLDVLKQPFVLNGRSDRPLTVSASIGIAVGGGGPAEDLLRDADIAMYRAKRDDKGRYMVFESGMHLAAQSVLELEMDLHSAARENQFCLVYQPIFGLRDMRATGMEALLRWNHPMRGRIAPVEFIPTLESSGLICEVGKWVLDEACAQGAAWRAAGTPIDMSVNVSAVQLNTDAFEGHVRSALESSRLDPGALTLEITETALMLDVEATVHRLSSIKELGVRIAIDDFGTGYSSLSHLQRFPIDSLKIDQSFIQQMSGNTEGEALISTLVQLGKALSIETLAEGIEQRPQLDQLLEHECDSGQGFLFARPLEAIDAGAFLQAQAVAPARGGELSPSRR
jgi:diguanylate cyclase (GGDEF)-like protein